MSLRRVDQSTLANYVEIVGYRSDTVATVSYLFFPFMSVNASARVCAKT